MNVHISTPAYICNFRPWSFLFEDFNLMQWQPFLVTCPWMFYSNLSWLHAYILAYIACRERTISWPNTLSDSSLLPSFFTETLLYIYRSISTLLITKKMHEQHQHQQQQPQQKLDRRSAGLEELIMGCTSSTSTKGETSIPQSQETEWPYPYWPPDNQDHHG